MLNRTGVACLDFPLNKTLKLNHCAYPQEFMSFCNIRSYYLSPTYMEKMLLYKSQTSLRFNNPI